MNEEQVTLQAIEQFVASHPERKLIESIATNLRNWISDPHSGDSARAAIALVGAEMAAQP